jgi:hypothetical protein
MSVASSQGSNNFTNYPPLYNLTLPANGDSVVLPLAAIGCVVNVINLSSTLGSIILPTTLVGSQVSIRNNNSSLNSFSLLTPNNDDIFTGLSPLSTITLGFYPSINPDFQWIILSSYFD